MSFSGLQPAYKAPTVTTPDDASLLTMVNALVGRSNDLYTIASALTSNYIIDQPQILAVNVNRKNIGQYADVLNYLANVIATKLIQVEKNNSVDSLTPSDQTQQESPDQ